MMTLPPPIPLVIAHRSCTDGFCAATLFKICMPTAEIIFSQYGDPFPLLDLQGNFIDFMDRDVYIVDFSFKQEQMQFILDRAKTLTVLDHHKTALADLKDFITKYPANFIFDMGKSGAGLAWEYLFSKGLIPEDLKDFRDGTHGLTSISLDNPHYLVSYVQDRDLWKWSLPESKVINACIGSLPFEFEQWVHWFYRSKNFNTISKNAMISEGSAIVRYQQKEIDSHLSVKFMAEFNGFTIPIVNATTLQSDILSKLAEKHPFSLGFRDGPEYRYCSLRSTDQGEDVSVIAKLYGGGGHRNASGFRCKLTDLLWKPL